MEKFVHTILSAAVGLLQSLCILTACDGSLWTAWKPFHDSGENSAGNSGEEDIGMHEIPLYYVAGVRYPDGYDWRRDPEYGTVECRMFLMQGENRILEFDVGYDYGVSSDADMARCIGEHVYTDYSTAAETVIKKDGKEMFRYPGREMISGFFIDGAGTVHTLGAPREGSGWSYRRNGKAVFSSDEGFPAAGFHFDGSVPVFCYRLPGDDFTGQKEAWYLVRGEMETAIPLPGQGCLVKDCLSLNGNLYVLYRDEGGNTGLLRNYEMMELIPPENTVVSGLTGLESDGLSAYVLGEVSGPGGTVCSVLWKEENVCRIFDPEVGITACYPEEGGFGAIGYDRISAAPVVFTGGEYVALPENYVFVPENPAEFQNGHYCLLLMPSESSDPPIYVIDGETYTMDINGYVFSAGCRMVSMF